MNSDESITIRQAINEVFGEFKITTCDKDQYIDYQIDIDVNEIMYSLLEELM